MLIEQLPDLELALIDLRDKNVIAISDLSTYILTPTSDQLALQITPPGYPTINVPFTPLNVNVYKCVDLGLTCSNTGCTPLPDGIYDVVYTVTINTNINSNIPQITSIERKFIKIDQIKCAYQHAWVKIKLECSCHDHSMDQYKEALEQIKLYIDGSVAACNDTDYVKSNAFYNKAKYMLNNLSCTFGKGCKC